MSITTNRAVSFLIAFALLFNSAFSFVAAENLYSGKRDGLFTVMPICTAFGIEYRKVPDGAPLPTQNHAEKHCILCYLSSVSVGAFSLPEATIISLPIEVVKSFLAWREKPYIARYSLSLSSPRAPPHFFS